MKRTTEARRFSAENLAAWRRQDAPSRGDQSPLDTRLRRDTPLPYGVDGG